MYSSMSMGTPWPADMIDVRIADRARCTLDEVRSMPMPDVMKWAYLLKAESLHAEAHRAEAEAH